MDPTNSKISVTTFEKIFDFNLIDFLKKIFGKNGLEIGDSPDLPFNLMSLSRADSHQNSHYLCLQDLLL